MRKYELNVPLGIGLGLAALIIGAALEGIRPGFLLQPTAALVVLGGTLAAAIVMRGVSGTWAATRAVFGLMVRDTSDDARVTIARLAWIARSAERDGARFFEGQAAVADDPVVARALGLIAEYAQPQRVRAELGRMLDDEDYEGTQDAATIEAAGGYAPTFGILGAVLGLISVLRAIDDPAALGTGIATAFVATIYGVGFANLVLFPIAARMRERHKEHMRRRDVIAEALVGLAAKEMPSAIASRADSLDMAPAVRAVAR